MFFFFICLGALSSLSRDKSGPGESCRSCRGILILLLKALLLYLGSKQLHWQIRDTFPFADSPRASWLAALSYLRLGWDAQEVRVRRGINWKNGNFHSQSSPLCPPLYQERVNFLVCVLGRGIYKKKRPPSFLTFTRELINGLEILALKGCKKELRAKVGKIIAQKSLGAFSTLSAPIIYSHLRQNVNLRPNIAGK